MICWRSAATCALSIFLVQGASGASPFVGAIAMLDDDCDDVVDALEATGVQEFLWTETMGTEQELIVGWSGVLDFWLDGQLLDGVGWWDCEDGSMIFTFSNIDEVDTITISQLGGVITVTFEGGTVFAAPERFVVDQGTTFANGVCKCWPSTASGTVVSACATAQDCNDIKPCKETGGGAATAYCEWRATSSSN